MTSLTFKNAMYWDVRAVAGVLAATMLDSVLGRWLEPEPGVRAQSLFVYYTARVAEAIRGGAARMVEHGDEVIAAALWLPCGSADRPARSATAGGNGFDERLSQVGTALNSRHLPHPHLRLAGLGVLHRWQRHGIATRLLTEDDMAPLRPARCVTAVAGAFTDLCTQCGYRPQGEPVLLNGGHATVRMMVRAPTVCAARSRNSVAESRLRPVTGMASGTVGFVDHRRRDGS
ncbi:hypothetical protein [Actinoplanes sp. DH11]|uniref:hypothetical protein n=1 Tax=Actinoplanes sp. DH11 TaxID=2857011 RepID=UPI001E3DC214|nr:hypothetical protein [Actinoplanes sp. DH11]